MTKAYKNKIHHKHNDDNPKICYLVFDVKIDIYKIIKSIIIVPVSPINL